MAGSPITGASQNSAGTPGHKGDSIGQQERRVRPSTERRGDGLINLTFVSDAVMAAGEVAREIERIRTGAAERNAQRQITGVLLFTGTRFVQTVEAPAAVVDALMARIMVDPRHTAVCVVDRRGVAVRNFRCWSLTYAGPSLFVARTVSRGVAGFHHGIPGDVARLLTMMVEFGAAGPLSSGS